MILNIIGPMRGYPESNFPAFFEAEARLEAAGYVVRNPARNSTPEADGDPVQRTAVLARGIQQLAGTQGIATLEGWRESEGATREHQWAWLRGLPIQDVDFWIENGTPRCIRWIGDPLFKPQKSYAGDAGFDLVVSQETTLHVGEFRDVPLGISVELPEGVWAMLVGRSSTLRRRGVLVAQGIIDNGYRGPLFAGCQNLSDRVVTLGRGERIAQLIAMPLETQSIGLRRVDTLSSSDRGVNGFGSSGV